MTTALKPAADAPSSSVFPAPLSDAPLPQRGVANDKYDTLDEVLVEKMKDTKMQGMVIIGSVTEVGRFNDMVLEKVAASSGGGSCKCVAPVVSRSLAPQRKVDNIIWAGWFLKVGCLAGLFALCPTLF